MSFYLYRFSFYNNNLFFSYINLPKSQIIMSYSRNQSILKIKIWLCASKFMDFFIICFTMCILKYAQRYGSNITEKSPAAPILLLPVSFYSSQFSPLISISFLIWSIHLVLCLPLGSSPSIFMCILSSLVCITCPNHFNLLF